MSRMTPPMGISGSFLLRDPFVADPNKTYTVIALRTFEEMLARGQDPLKVVYLPVNLTETALENDKSAGALVVCLRDKTGGLIYVPDTYIDQYPSMGSVPYSRLVAAVSLGMWPDGRDMTDVIQTLKDAIRANMGVDPEVHITRAATSDYMSESDHVQLTASRRAAVTNNETSAATIIRLSDTVQRLERTVQEQTLIIEALTQQLNNP